MRFFGRRPSPEPPALRQLPDDAEELAVVQKESDSLDAGYLGADAEMKGMAISAGLNELATMRYGMGNLELAASTCQKAIAAAPDNFWPWLLLAEISCAYGHVQTGAETALKEAKHRWEKSGFADQSPELISDQQHAFVVLRWNQEVKKVEQMIREARRR